LFKLGESLAHTFPAENFVIPTREEKPAMRRAPVRMVRVALVFSFFLLANICAGKPQRRVESLAISPDGKLIALSYSSGDTTFIYTVAVDTGHAVRLTSAKTGKELRPSFVPDGNRIAYTYSAGKEAHSQIIIVNADGSNPQAWSPFQVGDFGPVFSPDNKTIVFSRSGFFGSYSTIAQPHAHDWNIYAADLDGSNVRQLTNEHFYMASAPSISADGTKLVVVAESPETSQHFKIYSLARTGDPLQTFQPHMPKEVSHKNPIFNCPNYLPDGSILFMAADTRFNYDVYSVNPDTGAIRKITNENGYATDLQVSADGKTAVFLKWKRKRFEVTDESELYVLDVESRKLTPIVVSGLN
jgi:Tol biopolymer transport system component